MHTDAATCVPHSPATMPPHNHPCRRSCVHVRGSTGARLRQRSPGRGRTFGGGCAPGSVAALGCTSCSARSRRLWLRLPLRRIQRGRASGWSCAPGSVAALGCTSCSARSRRLWLRLPLKLRLRFRFSLQMWRQLRLDSRTKSHVLAYRFFFRPLSTVVSCFTCIYCLETWPPTGWGARHF